jgi:hypothetical protein
LDSHENDLEGALVVATRNADGSFGAIERIVTKFHSTVKKYNANQLEYVNGNDGRQEPKLFMEAKGHGMTKYASGSDDGTWIKYYSSTTSVVPNGEVKTQSLGYTLVSTEILWNRRNNSETFAGNSFVGDNGDGDNKASAPWGWEGGKMGKDPALYIKDLFGLNSSYKTNYIRERYMK